MSITRIDRLLADLLIKKPVAPSDLPADFEGLLQRADWHGITPLLHHQIQHSSNVDVIPAALLEVLKSTVTSAIAGNLFSINELEKVINLFQKNNLDFIIIKGAALAHCLYPEAHLRLRCDTDILFADKDTVIKAASFLESTGYTQPVAISGELISKQISCHKICKSGYTHAMDMHWEVNNHPGFAGLFPFNDIKKQSFQLNLPGAPACPSFVHSLLFACLHRVAHIPFGEGNRLIWLYDIHLLSNNFTNEQWNEFIRLAINKRLAAAALDSLTKSRDYLGTLIPQEIIIQLENHINESVVIPEYSYSKWRELLKTIRALHGWQQRAQYIKEIMFPNSEYMLRKYQDRNKWMLPYLYIKRGITGAIKLFR
jgi:hypothetical protein